MPTVVQAQGYGYTVKRLLASSIGFSCYSTLRYSKCKLGLSSMLVSITTCKKVLFYLGMKPKTSLISRLFQYIWNGVTISQKILYNKEQMSDIHPRTFDLRITVSIGAKLRF